MKSSTKIAPILILIVLATGCASSKNIFNSVKTNNILLSSFKAEINQLNNDSIFDNKSVLNLSNTLTKVEVKNIQGETVFGYKDPTGKWAILPQYTNASDFKAGIAQVQIKQNNQILSFYINKKNQKIPDI